MTKADDFLIRFWGVRGSIATPGLATVRYGGNTSSIEVGCGASLLLLDGGTGMRALGNQLLAEAPLEADLFFSTHTSTTSADCPSSNRSSSHSTASGSGPGTWAPA